MPVYYLEMGHGHYFRPPQSWKSSAKATSFQVAEAFSPYDEVTLDLKPLISIPPKYSLSQNGYIGPIATSRLSAKTGDSLAQAQFPLELSRTRVMEQRCLSSIRMAQTNKRRRHVRRSGLRAQHFGYLHTKRG